MSGNQDGFLNVDLDITCAHGFDALIVALSRDMILLTRDGDFASLEVNEQFHSPSDTISRIADIVHTLDDNIRDIWNNSEQRILNVGVASAPSVAQQTIPVSPLAVSRVATIGASLVFTFYSRRDD